MNDGEVKSEEFANDHKALVKLATHARANKSASNVHPGVLPEA